MSTPSRPPRAQSPRTAAARSCVLFDLDGTLIDSLPLIHRSLRHAAETVLDSVPGDEVLLQNVGLPLRQQMLAPCPEEADELVGCCRAYNEECHDTLVAGFPGTSETLTLLRSAGIKLGVVTSKTSKLAARGLALAGLACFFEVVIGADDVERHKPDPLPVVEAARRLGARPARCAYVGDSPFDIEAARSSGALAVAAAWGAVDERSLRAADPDVLLGDITELPSLVCPGASGHVQARALP